MSTIPITLPQCGEPAAVRIEVYSHDGASLDASAYTCPGHTIHALAVIDRAGRTGRPIGMAPDITRPCGHVHVYPTGQLADPADMPHPSWCDRKDCRQRGRHRSIRLPVTTGHPEAAIVDMSLTQALIRDAELMMVLTVVDGDNGSRETALSLGQGRVLSHQVRRLLDLSKGYSGNRRRPTW
jgi:hypothetical protein